MALFDKDFKSRIQSAGKRIVSSFKQTIKRKGISASGNLKKQLGYKFQQVSKSVFRLRFTAPDYYKAVEKGRSRGSMPPTESIKGWIKDKNINTGDKGLDSTAFAIAKSIGEEGTKAQPFIQPTLKEEQPKVARDLGKQVERNFKQDVNRAFSK